MSSLQKTASVSSLHRVGPRHNMTHASISCFICLTGSSSSSVVTLVAIGVLFTAILGGCLWGFGGTNASMLTAGKVFVAFAALDALMLVVLCCYSTRCWCKSWKELREASLEEKIHINHKDRSNPLFLK